MSTIALSPEQLIYAQGAEIKTNSLKIAEAFGKRHSDVLRDIEKIITQVSDFFGKRNFAFSEYEQVNSLGLMTKYKMYELTKDGFVMVVMSYSGQKAMLVKEAYINAFNDMQNQLYRDHGIKTPLDPPTITTAQRGELYSRVANKSRTSNKPAAYYWSRFNNHFTLSSYKDLPLEKYAEAIDYLDRLEGENDPLITISMEELDSIFREKIKELRNRNPLQEPKYRQMAMSAYNNYIENTLALLGDKAKEINLPEIDTLTLDGLLTEFVSRSKWMLCFDPCDNRITMQAVNANTLSFTFDEWITVAKNRGYLVVKQTEIINRLSA